MISKWCCLVAVPPSSPRHSNIIYVISAVLYSVCAPTANNIRLLLHSTNDMMWTWFLSVLKNLGVEASVLSLRFNPRQKLSFNFSGFALPLVCCFDPLFKYIGGNIYSQKWCRCYLTFYYIVEQVGPACIPYDTMVLCKKWKKCNGIFKLFSLIHSTLVRFSHIYSFLRYAPSTYALYIWRSCKKQRETGDGYFSILLWDVDSDGGAGAWLQLVYLYTDSGYI